MESIEKLRERCDFLDGNLCDGCSKKLHLIADEIEAEIAVNYLELPVDADGVSIHMGDMLVLPNSDYPPMEVVGISFDGNDWFFDGSVTMSFMGLGGHYNTAGWKHVKPRTLEDVLRDCCDEYYKACKSEYAVNLADIHRKYAAEIRELLGGEAE